MKRIYATAMKENLGSIKIMKKIGLELESEYLEESFVGSNKKAVLYSRIY